MVGQAAFTLLIVVLFNLIQPVGWTLGLVRLQDVVIGAGLSLILGALLFYLITNTASWLFNPFHNPEYTKNFLGWLTALTKGTGGYPETWQFFRNTLLSGGLFTGLFVGAKKLTAESPAEKVAGAKSEEEPEAEPEEAKA